MRLVAGRYFDGLIADGISPAAEVAAHEDPTAECSWRPELERLGGPLPTTAVSGGRVVGGVYLFQNQRDRYWFLEVLIRDQAPEYRGVGIEVVEAAVAWWKSNAADRYQLRVHSMQRE